MLRGDPEAFAKTKMHDAGPLFGEVSQTDGTLALRQVLHYSTTAVVVLHCCICTIHHQVLYQVRLYDIILVQHPFAFLYSSTTEVSYECILFSASSYVVMLILRVFALLL